MPLLDKITTDCGIIGIWDLTETSSQLEIMYQLSLNETHQFSLITAERRRKEYLAARLLLQELLKVKTEILYGKNGDPLLKDNSLHVSISHSKEYVVVFLSERRVGIDIESIDRNIEKVSERFLSRQEYVFTQHTDNPDISRIICWCGKEAIFKCIPESNVRFNRDIVIEPFTPQQVGVLKAWFIRYRIEKKFLLHYRYIGNNVMVYCVEE